MFFDLVARSLRKFVVGCHWKIMLLLHINEAYKKYKGKASVNFTSSMHNPFAVSVDIDHPTRDHGIADSTVAKVQQSLSNQTDSNGTFTSPITNIQHHTGKIEGML